MRVVGLALFATLAVCGGASRNDEWQQALAQTAAIIVIAVSLWRLDWAPLVRRGGMMIFACLIGLLPMLQLVPLPPALWAGLPGHGFFAQVAQISGTSGWRQASLTPDLTQEALLALLPALAAALAMLYLDARAMRQAAEAVVMVAALSALVGLMQIALGGDSLRLYRITTQDAPVGLFANRNHQAVLMALALPLATAAAGLAWRAGDRVRAWISLGTVPVLLVALAACGSRMGLLLGLIGGAGAIATWRACAITLTPRVRWALPGAGLALAVPALAMLARAGTLVRLANADSASELRAQSLSPMFAAAKAFFPLGAGFGSFASIYPQFEPDRLLSTIYLNQAHCEPLQLVIEGGLPALILLAWFSGWWLRTVAAIARLSGAHRALALAWATASGIVLCSSLVDYPLRTPLLGAVFAAACIGLSRAVSGSRLVIS